MFSSILVVVTDFAKTELPRAMRHLRGDVDMNEGTLARPRSLNSITFFSAISSMRVAYNLGKSRVFPFLDRKFPHSYLAGS